MRHLLQARPNRVNIPGCNFHEEHRERSRLTILTRFARHSQLFGGGDRANSLEDSAFSLPLLQNIQLQQRPNLDRQAITLR
jgi:hypothetical protein